MTKKKWILIGGVVVLCLVICLCAVMCSSAGQGEAVSDEPTGTTGTGIMDYTVQVSAEAGTPLEGIGVYVYTDFRMEELVWFAKTDAEGKLTFTDIPSDNFVAVLSDVPAGYLVEEYYPLTGEMTQITLSTGLMEADLSKVTYKLGDLMLDFSVTAPDGTVYKFSELLEEKDVVILNFWYLECGPCKSEFPYLQEAYEQYSDKVAVLAMNPVNQDNEEIEQFRKDNGYTFPMMTCDPNWEKAMQITAYPTTVVIDRYGYISLIHRGSITEAETFEAVMDYFSAEDYEHTTFKNIEDLEKAAGVVQTVGTKENPIEMGVTPSFEVTVEPGQEMHYNIYRMTTMLYLTVRNENAYIIYNGQTYYPTSGVISIPVTAEDTSSALQLVFGNTSKETQTYTVTMAQEAGSMGNPYSLKLGDFTANVPEGKDQGIWYTFYPDMDGVFTLELKSAPSGVDYNISVTSIRNDIPVQRTLSEEGKENPETGNKMVALNAYKGGRVDINIGTYDGSGNRPAASFELTASLVEGTLDDVFKTLIVYSVNVTDESGNPISGVRLNMTMDEKELELTTVEGVATTRQVAGTYPVTMIVPRGYTAKTTQFKLTEKNPSVSIKLDTIEKQTYTIIVTDAAGAPLANAEVYFNDTAGELLTSAVTDAAGKVELTTTKDTYNVSIVKDGYISDAVQLTPTNNQATVALVEGTDENTVLYTVNVEDYIGAPMSGMKVTFVQNGSIKATADVVNGVATRRLLPGTYTVGVAGNYLTTGGTLTETKATVTVTVVKGVSGNTGRFFGSPVDILEEGATYVKDLTYSADNYFFFQPDKSGRYQFTFLNTKLETSSVMAASYLGNNTQYKQDLSESLNTDKMMALGNYFDANKKTFVVNIREKDLGGSYIIGVKNASAAVVVITWIGDAITDETDIEPDVYEATSNINWKSTFAKNTKFTYIDPITQTADDVKYVKGSDGYYHLGDANGPILYVNLGKSAPYLAMSDCMAVTDEDAVYLLIDVIYDDEGTPVARLRYNECLTQYVLARCENTDVYPLTDDLILILQRASAIKGWANYENEKSDYLFKDSVTNERIPGADEEIAWMYAVCYIEP